MTVAESVTESGEPRLSGTRGQRRRALLLGLGTLCTVLVGANLGGSRGVFSILRASAASPSVLAGGFCAGPSATTEAIQPTGVVWDGRGGFFFSVADSVHSEVCHVDAQGQITPYAGDGTPGYLPAPYGDDVVATGAEVYDPYGLAFNEGTLYIADSANARIRAVNSVGVISTVAGGSSLTQQLTLRRPMSVVPDGVGGVYVADPGQDRVLDVAATGLVTVVAGNGTAGFLGDGGPAPAAELNDPTSVAVGPRGVIYVADSNNDRIREIRDGIITTVAGTGQTGFSGDGGPATSARLNFPTGLSVDSAGNLYFADANNAVVRMVDTAGVISTVAGNGSPGYSGDGGAATRAELSWPVAVSVDSAGDLLVADQGTDHRIREVHDGIISTVAGNGFVGWSGDRGEASAASLSEPDAVAVGAAGTYVVDSENAAVRLVNSSGVISTVVPPWAGLGFPTAVALDSRGDLYIADWDDRVYELPVNGHLEVIAGTGKAGYSGDGGPATKATLNDPSGLALDAHGNLYVADSGNNVIREINPRGLITTYAGTGYATSSAHPLGDGGRARRATFNNPVGLDMTSAGLYVADKGNQRIRFISQSGVVRTVAGDGVLGWNADGTPSLETAMNFPQGVAVDAAGNILVTDDGNCEVREFKASTGTVSTLSGWGPAGGVRPTCGFIGADGTGMLNHPIGIALSGPGSYVVADSLNNRVRQFNY